MGCATVAGLLFRVAHYPALVLHPSAEDKVNGDVFGGVTAELLQQLDQYEGEEYSRQTAQVTMEDGQTFEAHCYCYVLPTTGLEWIRSGDWMRGAN
jgi:gamma-glutamylcyclotransferase (GGCT)/AIG2-like uncharacterized protein YtfP